MFTRASMFCILSLLLTTGLQADCSFQQFIQIEELSVGNMLNWTTSMEHKNAMFIIERSTDGINYTNIGAVKGAGDSNKTIAYTFLDSDKPLGQQYYRLRQIDFNGSFKISPVVVHNTNKNAIIKVSNLNMGTSTNTLTVQYHATTNGMVEYQLRDAHNQLLFTNATKAFSGNNKLQLDLSSFEQKVYYLTLKVGGQQQEVAFRKTVQAASH